MNHFEYKNKQLWVESIAIKTIANEVKTPFYCYSQKSIQGAYQKYNHNLKSIGSMICYAVKANSNQAIIKTLADCGAGADVVSEGELRRALMAGIPANKIVYSGVAKTHAEIKYALGKKIFQFNVESENELEVINNIAIGQNTRAAVAFRINPDVDAKTHAKISTGKSENKFGIPISQAVTIYRKAAAMKGIRVQGVDVHIGSQLTDLAPFRLAYQRIIKLVQDLATFGITIDTIDVGGGLGVNYEQKDNFDCTIEDYCTMLTATFSELNCKIILEPGRSLVAQSGVLVSNVIYKKQGEKSVFLIIDAAMNDLIRPSMYDAHHEILSVKQSEEVETYDIVGPVCETGDTFARNRKLTKMSEGDNLVITTVGAYGSVMASTYNTRLLIPEVLVNDAKFSIIKSRTNYADLINQDSLATWQA